MTFALSWAPALFLSRQCLHDDRPLGERLLSSAAYYAVAMGWQPLLAVAVIQRWLDPVGRRSCGFRPSRRRFLVLGCAAPLALALLALGVERAASAFSEPAGTMSPEALASNLEPTLSLLLRLSLAFAGTLSLLWVQTLAEEVGWRGYLLPRLMRGVGAWRGLALHGVLWGLWYAPILLLASEDPLRSLPRAGAFVLTCILLGTLLGWLRLASRSIVPSTVFNLALTVFAGLPFLVQGVDVGSRGAAYGPPGWIPMAIAIAILAAGPCRKAVERAAGPMSPRWSPAA